MLQQILIFSDSLTWGIIPNTRHRLAFDKRWSGVLEQRLLAKGHCVRILEDCLNGRRTAFEDPYKPGRNALKDIEQRMEMHAPLAMLIIMLGTNDFQSMHTHSAWHAAQGMIALIKAARNAAIEPGMPVPEILVVAPPALKTAKANMLEKFSGGDKKCIGLSQAYLKVANELDCHFFDGASVIQSSKVDGVHLDEDQHLHLGEAVADFVAQLISSDQTT